MPDLGTRCIENWPLTSRESARRVIDQYGQPDEITDAQLIWHKRGPWRQIIASKILYQHNFPAPHYALFELEPTAVEVIEQKPQRTRQRRTAQAKLQGKTKLTDKPAENKVPLTKVSLVKTPLSKSSLAKAPLAKSALEDAAKVSLTLRNKSAASARNSSAA
ncbi:hypothetical protein [Methylovirgula sp. HY1]|uniref:hypothetical protein n=1 Tax=Methylovirgula sp. HY1 TaxID=2822761 RepID=UPI001C5BE5D7|nr:hypothetical protein [Methylovirgula sp. HY1]QXX74289.1 hypothetical protein MHY1_01100 [Methylovirgula sp. HY1]